jgi:hypothetical protein
MKSRFLLAGASLVAALAPAALADGREPASLLIYPIHRSGPSLFTVISVTNTNVQPATPFSFGGSTLVHVQYLNTIHNPADTQLPLGCYVNDRTEFLTPADNLAVLTSCHNAPTAEGYVVIAAQDPAKFNVEWDFDYLIGCEFVVNAFGGAYSLNALPFKGKEIENNVGSIYDFDDREYEAIPKYHYSEFLAVAGSSLTLINLTGGADFVATVRFDIWNDNEQPLSATKTFRCWMEEALSDINPVFSDFYLRNNTPNDPEELDINCDNRDDFEMGWFKLVPIAAFSTANTISNPAILGAITEGPTATIDGGRLLWESDEEVENGKFLQVGVGN